jgi:UDP-GlcNAc3NAcA epimerase
MNLITIVGARPQFIKAAPVSAALLATGAIRERILHTGQHFDDDMSAVFFRELGIAPPAWNLGIGGGPHGAMTGAQLAAIESVLVAEKPDAVLVAATPTRRWPGAGGGQARWRIEPTCAVQPAHAERSTACSPIMCRAGCSRPPTPRW